MDPDQVPVAPPEPIAAPVAAIPSTPVAPSIPPIDPSLVSGLGINPADYGNVNDLVQAIAEQNRQQQATLRFVAGNMQQPPQTQPPVAQKPEEWTPEKHFASKWNLPARDPQWERMVASGTVVKDEDGRFVPAPGYEFLAASPHLDAMNHYERQYRESIQDYLAGNPYAKTYEALQQPLEKMIAARVAEELKSVREQERNEYFMSSWFQEHDKDLYAGVKTDPTTYKQVPILTPWAEKIQAYCNLLAENGVTDQAAQIRLAEQVIPRPTAPSTPPPAAQPAATSWLQDAYTRANNSGNANGSPVRLPNGTDRPNLDTFFVDRMKSMAG